MDRSSRVLLFGGTGFLGRELYRCLEGDCSVLGMGSRDFDLSSASATAKLIDLLRPTDTVVLLSALTPRFGRDLKTLRKNLDIADSLCTVLASRPVTHVVYVSSDAVYSMATPEICEATPAAPDELYGLMHRAREMMFAAAVSRDALAIVRPTMLIGVGDPHNSYGPNRFVRDAVRCGKIMLGGVGDDVRDYVHVRDAASLIKLIIQQRSSGLLNIASGNSRTGEEVALAVRKALGRPLEVCYVARGGAASKRFFKLEALKRAFPSFEFTLFSEVLAEMIAQENETQLASQRN